MNLLNRSVRFQCAANRIHCNSVWNGFNQFNSHSLLKPINVITQSNGMQTSTNVSCNAGLSVSSYNGDSLFSHPNWSLNELLSTSSNQSIDINDNEIDRLYQLSMLHMSDDQTVNESIRSMIQWMSAIHSVNTDTITPIYTPIQLIRKYTMNQHQQSNINSINTDNDADASADSIVDVSDRDRILHNAPRTDQGFILVPKVVDYH